MRPVVVFDCDGVLLVSNRLKTRMFADAALAGGFDPADAARFGKHVAGNFGTSRYRLFETLLTWDDVLVRPDISVDALVTLYADRLYAEYVRCPTTPGMIGILRDLGDAGVRMFVVSGSDGAELRRMFRERGLDSFFEGVFGSPTAKTDNLIAVADSLGIKAPAGDALVFIGDAEADYKAARAIGARFVYMDHFSTAKDRMRALQGEMGFERIRDLRPLPRMLGIGAEQI